MANRDGPEVGDDEELSWSFVLTAPGAWRGPHDATEDADWRSADVPGTVASALRALGRFDINKPLDLDRQDAWYRARLRGSGSRRIAFGGLATVAEVYVGGAPKFVSRSMFLEHEIECAVENEDWLWIAFRALGPLLDAPGPRARWRPLTIAPSSLRLWRTTLLGRMPGWQPPVYALGPWRPIHVRRLDGSQRLAEAILRTRLDDRTGVLEAELRIDNDDAAEARLACAGREIELVRRADGRLVGSLSVEGVEPWFPHTYGAPRLYEAEARIGERIWPLGRIGFRRLALDLADPNGFGLLVNDEPVFCRGAVWTTADLVSLPCARRAYEPLLRSMRDANLNMVRISGATAYEAKPFFDLCDELGLLVWQDFMFSNFDYPSKDPDFLDLVRREAEQTLRRIGPSPSLAVLCGGSEMAQQAAMLGLPSTSWSNPLFDEILRDVSAQSRPDCLYVPQTPFGGDLPFETSTGVCHYYGVSAYKRTLDDARRAKVRFSAESLGHATPSDIESVTLLPEGPTIDQPCWGPRRAGDSGAVWFFEDVRNHYIRELYGLDRARLQALDADLYLYYSRAANAELFEEVFSRWRRCGSPTRGALVWCWRDLFPYAGWGMLDSGGQPKSVWHALRRACRPVQVLLTDEGLGGLRVHLINETQDPVEATLSFACLRDGRTPVASAERSLRLEARSATSLSDTQLLGSFFDAAYAYRFGPPAHNVTVASLRGARDAALIAQAFHFPLGRGGAREPLGLTAVLDRDRTGWTIVVGVEQFAQSIHVEDEAFRTDDDWLHLPPGEPRRLRLIPRLSGVDQKPAGFVRALNSADVVRYGGTP